MKSPKGTGKASTPQGKMKPYSMANEFDEALVTR